MALGIEIMQQALRANNRFDEAERLRKGLLTQAGGAKISLIHATRGRPKRAATARKLWLDLAEDPASIEHIFVIDDDDKLSAPLCRMHHIVIPPGGCVAAWNAGAALTSGQVIIQMSDDWLPPPRWDAQILKRFGWRFWKCPYCAPETSRCPYCECFKDALKKPRVLAISDGHRTDDLLCMAIVTRKYFEQDSFLFHPDFTGVYSDNYFTDIAYQRNQVINARDLVFEHNHPAFSSARWVDETYARQNAPERFEAGQLVYNRLKENRDWSQVPGWFNYWPFYQGIARSLKDGDVVAGIGVWLGRSIIYLAQECRRLGKKVHFIAVDTFRGESNRADHLPTIEAHGGSIRAAFEENIERCGVADMIQIVEGYSADCAPNVADGWLAFCFIDTAHDYEGVKRDIKAWRPKIRAGGTLAGHDIHRPEVRRALEELIPAAKMENPVWYLRM